MLGSATKSFADIVMSGEMIENAIRCGKREAGESTRRLAPKKKENEVSNVNMGYAKPIMVNQLKVVATGQQASLRQEPNTKQNTEKPQFTPIPVTYRELYKRNPLPSHTDKGVNAIVNNMGRRIKLVVAEVRTPMREVLKKIVEKGLVMQDFGSKSREAGNYCEFHGEEDHEIEECNKFRALVQALVDNKELKFFEFTEKEYVCSSEEGLIEKVTEVNHPVVIISRPKINEVGAKITLRVVIQRPAAFLYKDNKRVPWNYNCNVTYPGEESLVSMPSTKAELGKGKSVMIEQGKERTKPLVNEPVTEDEAKEFLKFLKHSEYSVVEQLHKQPAYTSVLALLQNSEVHQNALMKVLNETYVTEDISVNKLDCLISNISADNFISFSDNEIPPGGMGSTKALHITTRCKGYTLPGVLIDNGLALNVLPLSTLNRLPIDSSHMKTCQNIVRAFDGTERKVMGRIERPWSRSAGAVPSSLHQKLKLVKEGHLITINAEEDIIASVTSSAPYIENDEKEIECSFQSLEFVNATFIIEWGRVPMPRISKATRISLQLTVGKRGGVIYPELKMKREGTVEDAMENLNINVISEEKVIKHDLASIRPYEHGSILNNWTAEEIPVVFSANTE
ncbi:uncharacterized protein LOC108458572 [Gossypium arboreum]|uniref:uncharacterized protein LOC108458572 n=1 Tax=Gossypium arboreum TaxID=29729 RepID=UPI0022F155AE|nr:uncharacterized protein LOC108458572 [Gossypium arboreum]